MDLFDNLNFANVLDSVDISGRSVALVPLMRNILAQETGYLSEFRKEGYLKRVVVSDEIVAPPSWGKKVNDFLIERGGRLVYRYLSYGDSSEDNNVYLWKDGFVDVSVSGNHVNLTGGSHNEQLGHDIHALFEGQWVVAGSQKLVKWKKTKKKNSNDSHNWAY